MQMFVVLLESKIKSIYGERIQCKSLAWSLDGWLLRTVHMN